MNSNFFKRAQMYMEPGLMLGLSIYHFLMVVVATITIDRAPFELLDINGLRRKAFASFWMSLAPPVRSSSNRPPGPGEPFFGIYSLISTATGTILEIGPGSGTHIPYFTPPLIDHIYGAEPCREMHSALATSAAAAGLSDKYTIVDCGGQPDSLLPALVRSGALEKESASEAFDTIVAVRVLCCLPQPAAALDAYYDLLKPGGRLIICEHVVAPWISASTGISLGRVFQTVYDMMGWGFFHGDCRLRQDTLRLLNEAGNKRGGWDKVEVESNMQRAVMPFITGVFVKKGAKGE